MFHEEELSIIQSSLHKHVFFKSVSLGKTLELRLPTACIRAIGVHHEIKSLLAKIWCYLHGSPHTDAKPKHFYYCMPSGTICYCTSHLLQLRLLTSMDV